jgi:serine/threonine protein kinase
MAPTILEGIVKGKPQIFYNSKVDLWSIGVIFYYFLTGKYLFGRGSENVLNNMKRLEPKIQDKSYFKNFTEKTRDMLHRLLQKKSQDRISWKEFFNHNIFQQEMHQEIKIDNQYSGIRILQKYKIEKEFLECSSIVNKRTNQKSQETSLPPDLGVSLFRKDLVHKKQKSQSQIITHRQQIVQNIGLNELTKDMYVINSLYNHEINKYMFVWYIFKKSLHYRKTPIYMKVHRIMNEMMFVILKQKKNRIDQLESAIKGKKNILMIKNNNSFNHFQNSKFQLDYCIYFRKIQKLFEEQISKLKDLLKENNNQNNRSYLPTNVTQGFKSYQKFFWKKIKKKMYENKDLMENCVELKQFQIFMLEVLFTYKLNANFKFIDQQTGSPFSWEEFYKTMMLMTFGDIQRKELELIVAYEW